MESDRELLELAAKAAGIYLEWDGDPAKWQPMYYEGKTYHAWEPLEDDGDALRLAVKLRMVIDVSTGTDAQAQYPIGRAYHFIDEDGSYGDESIEEITRRAIVRAAAEIGRAM